MHLKNKVSSLYENTKEKVHNIGEKYAKKKKQEAKADDIPDKARNKEKKNKLSSELENSIAAYNVAFERMKDYGTRLFIERQRAVDLIDLVEKLINSIANHPKSFDAAISEISMHREKFVGVCEFAQEELDAAKKSAMSAGGGIAAGAAVASLAPSAAMWIATTFGTASTGTAISTLSGAAATNAALAWLGGGALAAGGGGIAAGNAFLALAGPIGWSIAGATLLTSVVLFTRKKMKNNKAIKEEVEKVKMNTEAINESAAQIEVLYRQTNTLREQLGDIYEECLIAYGKGFDDVEKDCQMRLGTLVNNTKSLSVTLGTNI